MAEQDNGANTSEATASAGAETDSTPKTFTESDLQREADRRVSDAQKKWKTEQDALLADKTKDAETKLAELNTRAAEAEAKADFAEAATAAGIRNIKSAYIVAKHGDYIDKRGKFDVPLFKKDNPEFFGPAPNANAGSGAGAPAGSANMNDIIRQAAGYG